MNRHGNPFVAEQSTHSKVAAPDLPVFLTEQYGQCAEDVIVVGLLRALAKRHGWDLSQERYLEIGGNHPIATSASYLLHRQLGMTGVIVEANPRLIEPLQMARGDALVLHAAVSTGGGTTATLSVSNLSELSSLDRRFVLEWDGGRVGERELIDVPAIGINQILQNHFRQQVPIYLSIDIEGMDLEVLGDMDFERFRPTIVQAEPSDHHVENNSQQMIDLLIQKGYVLAARTDVNLIFVDSRVLWHVSESTSIRELEGRLERAIAQAAAQARNSDLERALAIQQNQELTLRLHAANTDNARLNAKAMASEAELGKCHEMLSNATRTIEAIRNSNSWKVTAPLRALTRMFKG